VSDRLSRGVELKREGKYPEAEAEIRALLADEPDNPEAHHELGLILTFTGDFDGSIEELRRAVELDGRFHQARIDLALVHMMLGMNDEARVELDSVLAEDPDNALARRHRQYL
jgi:Tfp pilus assembly protein PilF